MKKNGLNLDASTKNLNVLIGTELFPFKWNIYIVVFTSSPLVHGHYSSAWVLPYGVSMPCVLSLSWSVQLHLDVSQREQDVCSSGKSFWHTLH